MFKESLKIALGAIWVNKMRSLLTTLGIIIGISSVIAVVALGEGLKSSVSKEFENIGVKRIYFTMNWEKTILDRDILNHKDYDALKRAFAEDIKASSVTYTQGGKVIDENKGKKEIDVQLVGVNGEFPEIEPLDMKDGRFFMETDVSSYRTVAVIDQTLAKKLLGREAVVGERITVQLNNQSLSLVVVGTYATKSSSLNSAFGYVPPAMIYIPITTLEKTVGLDDFVYGIDINLQADADPMGVIDKMKAFMDRRHNTVGEDKYMGYSAEKQLEFANNFTGILTLVIGAIAAISLVVGGIGVMNIMLVSVTERTREIGIRKSLGARRQDILTQFLVEAVIISVLGGVVGTLLGVGFAYGLSALIKIPPHVGIGTIIVAWLFSAGVGIFFGIYPANKASKLDPIDALRYE